MGRGVRARTDHGGATVAAVACLGLLLLVGLALGEVGAWFAAHRQVRAAADLAALAGAGAVTADPCGRACQDSIFWAVFLGMPFWRLCWVLVIFGLPGGLQNRSKIDKHR